jgi:hypothetical protein
VNINEFITSAIVGHYNEERNAHILMDICMALQYVYWDIVV